MLAAERRAGVVGARFHQLEPKRFGNANIEKGYLVVLVLNRSMTSWQSASDGSCYPVRGPTTARQVSRGENRIAALPEAGVGVAGAADRAAVRGACAAPLNPPYIHIRSDGLNGRNQGMRSAS